LPVVLTLDGAPVEDLSLAVPDRARLQAQALATLTQLLRREGIDLGGLIARDIVVTVNGEPRVLAQRNYRLQLDGREAPLESPVLPGAEIIFEPGAGFQERVRDLLGSRPAPSGPAEEMAGASGQVPSTGLLGSGLMASGPPWTRLNGS